MKGDVIRGIIYWIALILLYVLIFQLRSIDDKRREDEYDKANFRYLEDPNEISTIK
jgi:hypothetical protein